MLFYESIDTRTLELLKGLFALPVLGETRLVGGTSLALQIGHRKSIDIDLFGRIKDDEFALLEGLKKVGKVETLKKTSNIHIYTINGIKVDIVNYTYPWIDNLLIEEEQRLAGLKDIAAMKLSAITGRGTKKDFIDLYFLLQTFSLKEMIAFYNNKYDDGSEFLVLKSITYFADAEENESPVMLQPLSWNEVKTSITKQTEDYLKLNR